VTGLSTPSTTSSRSFDNCGGPAVATTRGEGVGDLLLADAVRRVISASRSLAVFAIVVEATDEKAAAFYRDFRFAPFPSRPLRLFMPVPEVAEAVSRVLSRSAV